MTGGAAKERKVKGAAISAADAHERAKDFLTAGEVTRLLDAATAPATTCCS